MDDVNIVVQKETQRKLTESSGKIYRIENDD